jgi:hypothetical protein
MIIQDKATALSARCLSKESCTSKAPFALTPVAAVFPDLTRNCPLAKASGRNSPHTAERTWVYGALLIVEEMARRKY